MATTTMNDRCDCRWSVSFCWTKKIYHLMSLVHVMENIKGPLSLTCKLQPHTGFVKHTHTKSFQTQSEVKLCE